MSAQALRHFLDLTEIPVAELRGMIEASRAMKDRHKRDRLTRRQAARRQDARDDLRQALDAHARIVRSRDAPARRRCRDADRAGDAARPRRDHRGYRARALALCRRDHDPYPQPRSAGRACAARDRSGDQRSDAALASLPGDGRCDDLRGTQGTDQRPHGCLDRRRQQCALVMDACGEELRLPPQGRDAAGTQARQENRRLGEAVRRRGSSSGTIPRRRSRTPTAS